MTAVEQQTVIKLSQQFADFMEEDKKWKDNITSQLRPILQDRFEREVVSRYGKGVWKVFVALIGSIATIGVIFNYLVKPYILHWK